MAILSKWLIEIIGVLLPLVTCLPSNCPSDGESFILNGKLRPCHESVGKKQQCIQFPPGHLHECCNDWISKTFCISTKSPGPVSPAQEVGNSSVTPSNAVNDVTILGLPVWAFILILSLVILAVAALVILVALIRPEIRRCFHRCIYGNHCASATTVENLGLCRGCSRSRTTRSPRLHPYSFQAPRSARPPVSDAALPGGSTPIALAHLLPGLQSDSSNEATASASTPLLDARSATEQHPNPNGSASGQQRHTIATPQSEHPPAVVTNPPYISEPVQTATTSIGQSSASRLESETLLQQQQQNFASSSGRQNITANAVGNNVAQPQVTAGVGNGSTPTVTNQTNPMHPSTSVRQYAPGAFVIHNWNTTRPASGTAPGHGASQTSHAVGAPRTSPSALWPDSRQPIEVHHHYHNPQVVHAETYIGCDSQDSRTGRNTTFAPRRQRQRQRAFRNRSSSTGNSDDPTTERILSQRRAEAAHRDNTRTQAPPERPGHSSQGTNALSPAQLPRTETPAHYRVLSSERGHDSDGRRRPTFINHVIVRRHSTGPPDADYE